MSNYPERTTTTGGTRRWHLDRIGSAAGVAALVVAGALALSACGSSGGGGSGSGSNGGGSAAAVSHLHVSIINFAFAPSDVSVKPGATITVTNHDQVTHTFTSTSGAFDTGDIKPGQTKTIHAPTKPGTYAFDCTIHQYMTGTLIVS